MSDGQREPSLRDTISDAFDAGETTTAAPATTPSAEAKPAAVPGPAVAPSAAKGAEAAPAVPLTEAARALAAARKPVDPNAPAAAAEPAVDPNAPAKIPPGPPGFDLKEWAGATDATRTWIRNRERGYNEAWQKQSQQANFGKQVWNAMRPYEASLRATGANPVQLVDEFMATHDLLTRGSPEQKVQAVLRVCQKFGIDLGQAGQQSAEGAQPMAPHPEIAQLRRDMGMMANLLRGREQQASHQEAQQIWSGLETFAKNTENEFFPHLWERMAELIDAGAAKGRNHDETLRNAYQTAMWERPDIRAIVSDRDAARRAREAQAARQAATTGGTSPVSGGAAIQSDSLRGTIEAAWDKAA